VERNIISWFKNQYVKVCDIVKLGGEIFIFERMVFKMINYMLYIVKKDFHFKLSIKFYYCKNKHVAMQHWPGNRPFNSHTKQRKTDNFGIWEIGICVSLNFTKFVFDTCRVRLFIIIIFFKSKHLLLWNLSKKDITPFLKLNVLPITFVVSFIDALCLQFTLYLSINVIILLKLNTSIKSD
jgi:hypothetical protein